VHVTFDSLTTNVAGAVGKFRSYEPPVRIERGREWGRFEFGSTIVVVAAAGFVDLEPAQPGTSLRLGRRIGTLPHGAR
jgi:phosphatidylserine decarboxylase